MTTIFVIADLHFLNGGITGTLGLSDTNPNYPIAISTDTVAAASGE
ncbi:hypothetical protein KN246_22375 [Mycobacterium intracellulare]|nr:MULTISPECIES: hypothetical protein [Mycobacterium]EUA28726.1 hypothetical protein I548_1911 [Mycobacterium intracellulare]UGT96026.1 hypothetical protein LTQ55_20320 [Mycobacterium intracellulare]UGU05579.1 hypothetical protein LTQ56_16640 [Mycobacterium intracellulare subsp. intracellulare]UQB91910.1 hypothetical protein KN252_22410 [Mycobacterium intracellulare]UQB96899.1 hypothetical protein KN246_22375 [Mycobacterium intracellulare]